VRGNEVRLPGDGVEVYSRLPAAAVTRARDPGPPHRRRRRIVGFAAGLGTLAPLFSQLEIFRRREQTFAFR